MQALTTSTVKKGGYSSGDVAAQYIYKNTFVDVKVDTESNVRCSNLYYVKACFSLHFSDPSFSFWQIAATLAVADIIPSSKTIASFKFPNYESGKVRSLLFPLSPTA